MRPVPISTSRYVTSARRSTRCRGCSPRRRLGRPGATAGSSAGRTRTPAARATRTRRWHATTAVRRRLALADRLALEGLERHADDLQPALQSLEREAADLVAAGAQRLPVRALALRRRESGRHGGEQLAQGAPHAIGELRIALDRRTQEPDAVADVALLVMVNAAVAVDEAGQQLVLAQVAGDELERGQAERALDDQVVGGDELDLRGFVAWIGRQAVVSGDQGLVEDDREGLA